MADFLSNLWESVFTPGTTPTLLIATNCTFGALQVLLLALLIATYSIHFAILSILCGGLWYSVNWFAIELQAAQKAEAEADRLRKKKQADKDQRSKREGGELADADDEGEDTEVEDGVRGSTASLGGASIVSRGEVAKQEIMEALDAGGQAKLEASSGLQAVAGASQFRQRRGDGSDKAPSELSTDSEWEKVDER